MIPPLPCLRVLPPPRLAELLRSSLLIFISLCPRLLLPLRCSPLRPPPGFFLLGGGDAWCGGVGWPKPLKTNPLLKPPQPPLAYAHREATGCSRLNPTRPRSNDRFRPSLLSTWPRACPASEWEEASPRPRQVPLIRAVGPGERTPSDPAVALESLVTTNVRSDPC